MKRLLTLVLVIVALAGCATDRHSRSSSETSAVASGGHSVPQRPAVIQVLATPAKGENIFGRRIFEVGKQRFTTLPEFMTFIESLPPGSIVGWYSGCIR